VGSYDVKGQKMNFLINLIRFFLKKNKVQTKSAGQNHLVKVITKANELTESMNQLLREANQSKNIELREFNLLKVKEQLKTMKDISSKYPTIIITQLNGFESSINAVESETVALKITSKSQPNDEEGKRKHNEIDKQAIINNHLRIINESIDIARKSKSPETTNSRLVVARKVLNEARSLAKQYSLDIEFNEAEAEIDRLTDAVLAGTPKVFDGMREIEPDPMYSTPSRNLLKEATSLKKEKKYIDACDKLREAYAADGAEILIIEERLRLPMYLQLAGKNDEGWAELNKLLKKHNDQFSNQVILKQMQIFLKKENNADAKNPIRITEIVDMQHSFNLNYSSVEKWAGSQDVISGYEFKATMQLRTPLRVLKRHGEIHSDINSEPPKIANEMWEGIWIPKTKTFRELGLDVEEMPESTVASNIGQIRAKEYLPFLISVRQIIELDESINIRINKLRNVPMTGSWNAFVNQHGGIDRIINEFFPRFIDTIPNFNSTIIEALSKQGILTANQIRNASDDTLLSISGIGNAKLKSIREYCSKFKETSDEVRMDKVSR